MPGHVASRARLAPFREPRRHELDLVEARWRRFKQSLKNSTFGIGRRRKKSPAGKAKRPLGPGRQEKAALGARSIPGDKPMLCGAWRRWPRHRPAAAVGKDQFSLQATTAAQPAIARVSIAPAIQNAMRFILGLFAHVRIGGPHSPSSVRSCRRPRNHQHARRSPCDRRVHTYRARSANVHPPASWCGRTPID